MTIRESSNEGKISANHSPGPGDYSPKVSSKISSVIWKVGDSEYFRKANSKLSTLIGPGTYNPNYEATKPNSRLPIMPTSTRPPLHVETNTPGIGSYNIDNAYLSQGVSYSIPQAPLSAADSRDIISPGPGSYILPATIPQLPPYEAARLAVETIMIDGI